MCGVFLLGVTAIRLRRLRAEAHPETDERLHALLERAQMELGMRKFPVLLLSSSHCTMPMTWGLQRSLILLPANSREWSDERLLLVLRHELAHILRRDIWVTLLTTVSAMLLWFHPLVWRVLATAQQKREAACDDLALRHSEGTRDAFAAELLQTVVMSRSHRGLLPLAQAMAAKDVKALKQRLAAILDEEQSRRPYTKPGLWRIGGVIVFTAFILSGVSACRKVPTTAESMPHVFLLSDTQWHNLVSGDGGQVKKTELEIRNRLLEEGVQFITHPKRDSLFLKDERTMEVTVDEVNQAKITALLARLSKQQMIHLKSRVFSIPIGSTAMDDFKSALPPNKKLGMLGILKADQTKALIEKLYATQGMDMLGAPSLTTRSGQKCMVEVAREFIYPTKFDGPQFFENKPVTPTTPIHFEMRPVGIRLEVEPALIDSDRIDLTATPEFTSFDGFINYGTPITKQTQDAAGKSVEVELSENKILQPVFNTAKCTTSVILRRGETLLIGGLGLREKVSKDVTKQSRFQPSKTDLQSVADLGDLPYTDLLFFMIQAEVIEP